MSIMRTLRFVSQLGAAAYPLPRTAIAAAALSACALASLPAVAQTSTPAVTATAVPAPAQPSTPGSTVTTASGLVMKTLKAGTGPSPSATEMVKVHYRGTFPDGKEFDSSYTRGQPAEFPLNRVIRCWTEGVQLMKVGGRAQLICPAAIAYGERGTPGGPIPPNATLHFEVELLGIAGR